MYIYYYALLSNCVQQWNKANVLNCVWKVAVVY